jgi:hypothetical protein
MIIRSNRIEEYLSKTQIILQSLRDDAYVKGRIVSFGYTDERILQGIVMRDEIESAYHDLVTKRREQLKLFEILSEKHQATGKKYSYLVKIFKTNFSEEPELIKELGLTGKRSRNISNFIAQATNMYTTAMKKQHILDRLALFGYTPERLQEELDEIQELQRIFKEYRIVNGENQRLTVERDIKLAQFKRYMLELKTVLFMVFGDENPQTLERVGVFVRNPVSRSTEEEEEEQDPGQAGTNPPAETPEVPEIPPAAG